MSKEQLKLFLEKVKFDTRLQEKLKAASDVDTVLALAKESGFSISVDELQTISELSEEELENVTGGSSDNKHCYYYTSGMYTRCDD